jgi:hypothetical protein
MEPEITELEQMKANVYDAWAVINRSFEQIVTALNKMENTGLLKWDYVHHQSVLTNDLWAKINCHILSEVNTRELDDRNHYGKMRVALEKKRNK